MASSKRSKIYFIGNNYGGEFGLDHVDATKEFIECPNKSITKVFGGRGFNIYSDDEFGNIWSAGDNSTGACGVDVDRYDTDISIYTMIKYFKQNNIKLQDIFTSNAGESVFFLSISDDVYGCGQSLGIQKNGQSTIYPIQFLSDKNIIDIQSASLFSVALCSSNNEEILIMQLDKSRFITIGSK